MKHISLLARDSREKRDGSEGLSSRVEPVAHVLLVSLTIHERRRNCLPKQPRNLTNNPKNQGDQLTKNRPPCEVTGTCGVTRLLLLAFGLRLSMLIMALGFTLLALVLIGLRRFRSGSWRCDRWGWGWGWFRSWRGRLSEHAGEYQ
jgi:hypothetical protein